METEVQAYLTELGILKGQVREAIKGLDDKAANWQPLAKDTNSIYSMIAHLTGTETFWARRVIQGQTIPIETIKRDHEAQMKSTGELAQIVATWDRESHEDEKALEKLTLSELAETRSVVFMPRPVTVRWAIIHLISHYATHLGHIQLTRQLWFARNA